MKYLQAIDLNANDVNKIRPREKVEQQQPKEYPNSRALIKHEIISERPSQKSERYSHNQRLEDELGRENLRTARNPYEERLLATERGNEENRDPAYGYQQQSKKYKHIIKKLEQETKEKDYVIQEMIKSYKDLEHVVGNGHQRKRSRSKTRSGVRIIFLRDIRN